jgi:dihydropteroate synthase
LKNYILGVDKDTCFYKNITFNIKGKLIEVDEPKVVGILNITPDSFYKDSRLLYENEIVVKARKMLAQGAFALDIGAYSSRPGADNVSAEEEEKRLIPVVKLLRKEFGECILSVDTFRSQIAIKAIESGADIINDISGGDLDPEMFLAVAKLQVPYILMHMRGNPQTMASRDCYKDIVSDLVSYFQHKLFLLTNLGVKDIIIDPGFGFAKNINQNFELLKNLNGLNILGYPLLVGLSRKSMIYKTLDVSAEDALTGTIALHMIALQQGASFLRVHDVKEAVETVKIFKTLYF